MSTCNRTRAVRGAGALALTALTACGAGLGPEEFPGLDLDTPAAWETARFPARAADGLAEIHFTRPGTEPGAGEDPEADDALVDLLDAAEQRADLCLYEFKRGNVIDAAIRAAERGVVVRFAGDGDEADDEGYLRLQEAGVELVLRRPRDRIMHNKFVLVDDRWLTTGSMNVTETGVTMNNNNMLRFDSPVLADAYRAEFEQMYEQIRFGRKKDPLPRELPMVIGGRDVELYFSPEDDVKARLREAISGAERSLLFMIFAFTDVDVADDLIALHRAGVLVAGVADESQARGRYSVVERLAEAGVPVWIDGNGNSRGFAGGKLHHKVMVIDAGAPPSADPSVVTGSFNWTRSANDYNDENLLVLHGQDFAAPYLEEFCRVQEVATPHPLLAGAPPDPCANLLKPVRINEVMANPVGPDAAGEFVELVNTGGALVSLAGWTLGDGEDSVRHEFAETTVLSPGEALVVWSAPGPEGAEPRLVATDGRLSLANNSDEVVLADLDGVVVDRVQWRRARSGVSFNRSPDGASEGPLVLHTVLDEAQPPPPDPDDPDPPDEPPGPNAASPGVRADGSAWVPDPPTPLPLINELLANPDGADRGQEYVEIVNAGDATAALEGWTLGDAGNPARHVFGRFFLPPGHAVVVFDRGDHSALAEAVALGGAQVITASTESLSLNNRDETVTLTRADGTVADQLHYPGDRGSGESLGRVTDADIDAAFEDQAPTPGVRRDGSPWVVELPPARAVINELLPNPPGSDTGKEFIEIVNAGGTELDLTGWRLGDAVDPARHVFARGTVVAPGGAIVVFDRFDPATPPDLPNLPLELDPAMTVAASSGGLSLNNTGDLVTLAEDSGALADTVLYDRAPAGESLNRAVDALPDAPFIAHSELTADGDGDPAPAYSPGARATGAPWSD